MSAASLKRILTPLRRVLGGPEDGADAAEANSSRPSLGHIEDAFLELKEKERLILALRYYEKLSESDVASVLHMKDSEVRRIQREALDGVVRHLACASRG